MKAHEEKQIKLESELKKLSCSLLNIEDFQDFENQDVSQFEEINYDEQAREQIEFFKEFYKEGKFRHHYSRFFWIIENIDKDSDEFVLDYLLYNLKLILNVFFYEKNQGSISDTQLIGLEKLYDHINLEFARFNKYRSLENERDALRNDIISANKKYESISKELISTQKQTEELTTNLDGAKKELKEANEKMKKHQVEIVTVLSIFTAIVFSCFGSLNFAALSLSNVKENGIINFIIIIYSLTLFLISILKFLFDKVFELIFQRKLINNKITYLILIFGFCFLFLFVLLL